MVEFLNDENRAEFVKLFKKALKKNEFKDIQDLEGACILLYKEANSYVGFLEGFIELNRLTNTNVAHILAIYVLPNYRNEGKAYSMIEKFEEWLKDKNCTDVVASMSIKNKKSLDFFDKVSFQNVGTCVFMKKSINKN